MYALQHAALTHPGTVRELNEDSVLDRPPVFVVADGIGGHQAGELASAAVVGVFAELVDRAEQGRVPIDADVVAAALNEAHSRVRALHQDRGRADSYGAGSTACGAVVTDTEGEPYWLLFNIGDSRVYRHAPGEPRLTQISVDHSHVQELVDAGVITADQALHHPDRNLVTRAIGTQREVRPDFWLRPLVPGERLLICSDGLLQAGFTAEMTALACGREPADRVVHGLLDLSLRSGAQDNVSVIVVDVVAADPDRGHSDPGRDTGREPSLDPGRTQAEGVR